MNICCARMDWGEPSIWLKMKFRLIKCFETSDRLEIKHIAWIRLCYVKQIGSNKRNGHQNQLNLKTDKEN